LLSPPLLNLDQHRNFCSITENSLWPIAYGGFNKLSEVSLRVLNLP
jgi:hypothetical protein